MNPLQKTVTCILLAGSVTCLAQTLSPGADESSNLARLLAEQKVINPVSQMMQGLLLEENHRYSEAVESYLTVLDKWPDNSRWANRARLRIAGCLLRKENPDPKAASDILEKLNPAEASMPDKREQRLWQLLVKLHTIADRWLAGDGSGFDANANDAVADWRPPSPLLNEFSEALDRLFDRFVQADKPELATRFAHELLMRTTSEPLQPIVLRKLISLQLLSKDTQAAIRTARAYWLVAVNQLALLPEAVERVVQCMEALGAAEAQIEHYRLLQTLGDRATDQPSNGDETNPLQTILGKNVATEPLFSIEIINSQPSDVVKARLHLINGDLAHAVPILKRLADPLGHTPKQRKEILKALRMAFAVHDGHIHDADRYERYLYQKSSVKTDGATSAEEKDPLDQLMEGTAGDATVSHN
jgi:hypothetical protein